MLNLLRTNSQNIFFIELVKFLDFELVMRDGEDHSFYAQYNKIDDLKHVVIAFEDERPIGCGAIKEYSPNTMEIKRMFTYETERGKGFASKILSELEKWAAELHYKKCILETGIRQPEAIRLYEKNGYKLIPNYGQYAKVENSRCFEKTLLV